MKLCKLLYICVYDLDMTHTGYLLKHAVGQVLYSSSDELVVTYNYCWCITINWNSQCSPSVIYIELRFSLEGYV